MLHNTWNKVDASIIQPLYVLIFKGAFNFDLRYVLSHNFKYVITIFPKVYMTAKDN